MNREEKSATIQEIAAQIEASEAIFAVDYRGISVPQAAELRAKLREADATFRIVKNRLTKLAADKAGEARLAELLEGPTALTFVRGDTAQAAKAITTFNKEHEVLTYKGGFMAETVLDEDGFKSIARLPGRDVLNGQFAGLVTGEAPASQPAGPVEEDDSSSSQAAGEEPPSTPPAGEAEEADGEEPKAEEPSEEEPKTEEPSEEPAEEPAAEASEGSGQETSEQDSKEEEEQ
jgi:large subunit ribosomal protein L10